MGRPRKDQNLPSATERMKTAFWQTLEEKPYDAIRVGDIVEKAQVNRNAFYYHYDNLDDLAYEALENILLPDLLMRLVGTLNDPSTGFEGIIDAFQSTGVFDKARLLSGEHGTARLLEIVKSNIRTVWYETFNVDSRTLGFDIQIIIEFLLGGIFAVLGTWREQPEGFDPEQLITSPYLRALMQAAVNALASAGKNAMVPILITADEIPNAPVVITNGDTA